MSKFRVAFARSATKELESLSERFVERVLAKIETLADVPKPRSARKLSGETDLWRLRVGDYRVVYSVDERRRLVDVIAVRNRKDAYR